MNPFTETTSTRPYLIRALHEWCCDNGLTPYITVAVDNSVQVPREYVNDGEIVLNVGFDATTALSLGKDYIEFKARFGGVVRDILIPINQVQAIFARENGQGMAFPRVDRTVEVSAPNLQDKPSAALREVESSNTQSTAAARLSSVQAGEGSKLKTPSPKSVAKKKASPPALTRIK